MKRSFFQAAVVSILLYGCTTWTQTKRLEKKLEGNYTRTLRTVLNKSWRKHPTKHQLYGHLPPITKTIQVRRTRHAGHCWRSTNELISDVLLWTLIYGRAKAGRPARTYIQQLCEDTGCSIEDLPEAINEREKRRERVRDIRAGGTTWGLWWWFISLWKLWYLYSPQLLVKGIDRLSIILELHKNVLCCLEQNVEATPHKRAAARSLVSYLTNHSSKTNDTCGTLLKKQVRTHKRGFLMNSCIWTCQCWLTNKDLYQLYITTVRT